MKSTAIILFLLSIYSSAFAQSPKFISEELDNYIIEGMTIWNIPGAAVCIIKDSSIVHNKGYGYLEKGKSPKVDTNTLFMIGSNTKAFTATALAKLHFDQKCTLNDKVTQWLPEFRLHDSLSSAQLNISDLLCHRMGYETFQGDFMYWNSDLSGDEVLKKFGQLTPTYEFRTKWGYTNAGYVAAGKCIEKICNTSWEDYLQQHFFEPLQMNRTIALHSQLQGVKNVSSPHSCFNNTMNVIDYCNIDNIAPAASVFSSSEDMSHWVKMLLNKGYFNDTIVVPQAIIERTWKPESIIRNGYHPYNNTNFNLYGLGWNLTDYEGRKIISHTGGVNGYVSSVTLVPSEGLGIIILTNTDNNALYVSLKWEIIDAYLKLPFRNYNIFFKKLLEPYEKNKESAIKQLKDSVALNLVPTLKLAQYAGTYTHSIYGNITLTINNNKLLATFEHHPNLTADIESIGNQRFVCTFSDPTLGIHLIPFDVEEGQVQSLTLSVTDMLDQTKYKFIKNKKE